LSSQEDLSSPLLEEDEEQDSGYDEDTELWSDSDDSSEENLVLDQDPVRVSASSSREPVDSPAPSRSSATLPSRSRDTSLPSLYTPPSPIPRTKYPRGTPVFDDRTPSEPGRFLNPVPEEPKEGTNILPRRPVQLSHRSSFYGHSELGFRGYQARGRAELSQEMSGLHSGFTSAIPMINEEPASSQSHEAFHGFNHDFLDFETQPLSSGSPEPDFFENLERSTLDTKPGRRVRSRSLGNQNNEPQVADAIRNVRERPRQNPRDMPRRGTRANSAILVIIFFFFVVVELFTLFLFEAYPNPIVPSDSWFLRAQASLGN